MTAGDVGRIAETLHGIVEGLLGSAVDGGQPLMEVRLAAVEVWVRKSADISSLCGFRVS